MRRHAAALGSFALLAAFAPNFAATPRPHTVTVVRYNGVNLVMPGTVELFHGTSTDMVVAGQFVNLATRLEVRTDQDVTTTAITATVIGTSGSDATGVGGPGASNITIRLSNTSGTPLGGYTLLLHYLVETNGPDRVPLVLYERGTVTGLAFTSPAPRPDPSAPAFLAGDNLTLHLQGTGMSRATLAALPRGMHVVQTVSRSSTDATFIVRFDSSGLLSVPYSRLVLDGTDTPSSFDCSLRCYPGSGQMAIMLRVLPAVASASPGTVPAGSPVTLSGARLEPAGYSPQVLFLSKYRRTDTPNSVAPVVTALSGGSLSFAAPAAVRPDSIVLRYLIAGSTVFRDSLAATVVPVPPIVTTGNRPVIQLIDSAGPAAGMLRAVLRVGQQILNGENLTNDPSSSTFLTSKTIVSPLPSLQFGGIALAVQSAGYNPVSTAVPVARQLGADSIVFTVPSGSATFADTMTRSLVVTTTGGSFSTAPNVVFVPPPTLTEIRTFDPTTDVSVSVPLSGGRLDRGKQYRLRGKGLVVGSTVFNAVPVRVFVNGSNCFVDLAPNLEAVFTVPPTATSGPLKLIGLGGTITTPNSFTVGDPPAALTIVGASLSPTTVVGGQTSTATVAINGTVAPDGSSGSLAVTLATPDPAVILPTTLVPIKANPMVVAIKTRGVAAERTDTIRFSNDPNAPSLGTVSAPLTLRPVTPSSVTVSPSAVVGGTTARGVVRLNANVNGATGLSVALVNSDPTTATLPPTASIVGDSAVFAVSTAVPPTDRPVTITATSGGASQSATFTVKAATLNAVSAQPTSVMSASGSAAVTVTLSGALAAPATLTVSCNTDLVCPPSATINAGQSSTSFTVTARTVLATTSDTVNVTMNATTQRAVVTVTPLLIQTLTLSPTSVKAGVNSSLTIQLNAPVPAGLSASVALTSSDPSVQVPSSPVAFAGGDQTRLVALTTVGPLAANKIVTITATFSESTTNGLVTSRKTAVLTVTP